MKLSNDQPTRIQSEVKTPERTEFKLVDQLSPKRGHTVWEVNVLTMEVVEAEFEKVDLVLSLQWMAERFILNPDSYANPRILRKPNCIYISALKKEGALKRMKKK